MRIVTQESSIIKALRKSMSMAVAILSISTVVTFSGIDDSPAEALTSSLSTYSMVDESCPTSSYCVAYASASNGIRGSFTIVTTDAWSTWTAYPLTSPGVSFYSISCGTTRFCLLTGSSTYVSTDGGVNWTPLSNTPSVSFQQVRCISDTACAAITNGDAYYTSDGGGTWTDLATFGLNSVANLSCRVDGNCIVAGSNIRYKGNYCDPGCWGHYETFDVATRFKIGVPSFTQLIKTGFGDTTTPDFLSVDCVSSTFCITLSGNGGQIWKGTQAVVLGVQQILPSNVSRITRIDCVDVNFCAGPGTVNGMSGIVFTTDGGLNWRSQALQPGWTLKGLTCPRTNECDFVGDVNGAGFAGQTLDSAQSFNTSQISISTTSAPLGITVTPGNQSLRLAWNQPQDLGNTVVIGYVATVTGGGQSFTCTSTSTGCNISFLSNGTSYSASVLANNMVGSSAASTSVSGTPNTLPKSPYGISLTPGNQQVAVSWTAGLNGGSASSYVATASDGNASFTCTTSSTSCTISGLVNGNAYSVTVVATNAIGSSSASAPSVVGTPLGVPDAPTNVAFSVANQQMTVTWTASNARGAAVTRYVISVRSGTQTISCTWTSGPLMCPLTNLVNGTSYPVTVVAYNSVGASASASPSSNAVPFTVPTAPTGVGATSGDSQIVVAWNPPNSNGGSAVTSYTASATSGSMTQSCTTSNTTCTITGLTNGVNYQISVLATNAAGDSSSATYGNVNPSSTPAAPSSVQVQSSNGSLVVSWQAPASNGGTSISSYTATAIAGNKSFTCQTPSTSCTISGLTNGTSYSVSVTATNSVGAGSPSYPAVSGTPASVAGSPSGIQITPGDGRLTVYWTAPASNGGSAITSYIATASNGNSSASCTATTSPWSCIITGLTNGVTYPISVVAINSAGTSAGSLSINAIPVGVPSAVTQIAFGVANGSITATWTAPSSNGGSAITGYTVTATASGVSHSCATTTGTSCTITSLINGTAYTVQIVASNASGNSAILSRTGVTPKAVAPGAPSSLSATPNTDGAVSLQWFAPEDNGGSSIISYTVTSTPDGLTCVALAPATNCRISGLQLGTPYSFDVYATTAIGSSMHSDVVATVPFSVPSAPTTVIASTVGSGSIQVSWNAPSSDGGSAVTGYTVTATPGGAKCTTDQYTTSCTISGLTNGTSYVVSVVAINSQGSSTGALSSSITPTVAPGTPTNVTTSVSPLGTVTISWSAPASTGGTSIQRYVVSVAGSSSQCSAQAPSTSCTLSGLVFGIRYTISVSAVNSAGTSAASTVAITPQTVPSAPTSVISTAAPGQMTVRWAAVTQTGGSSLTGYTVTMRPGSATCSASSSQTTCTVTGLTNGVSYTASVVATNATGSSNASASSPSATPLDFPSAPVAPVAQMTGSGQVTVSWSLSVTDGGSAISSYTVTASPGGAACTATSPTTICTVSGLTNGTSYQFAVTATNTLGSSGSAMSNSVTPVVVPGTPMNVVATPSNQSATVTWVAPTSNGGATITSYTVTSSPGSLTCTWTSGPLSCVVSGLTNGTAYTFRVTAVNSAGSSPSSVSSSVTPAVAPSAPTGLTVTGGHQSLNLSWSAPSSDGGSRITNYQVAISPAAGAGCTGLKGTDKSCSITGLTSGATYSITMRAVNGVGTSAASAAVNGTVLTEVPSAPPAASATGGNGSATVTWTAPTSNGGASIAGYTVTSSPDGLKCQWSSGPLSCTVTGLINGTSYTFLVVAINSAGSSPSTTASAITPHATLAAPTVSLVSATTTSLTLKVVLPTAPAGVTIASKSYSINGGTTWSALTVTNGTAVISGLKTKTAYSVLVRTVDNFGTAGATSTALKVTTK